MGVRGFGVRSSCESKWGSDLVGFTRIWSGGRKRELTGCKLQVEGCRFFSEVGGAGGSVVQHIWAVLARVSSQIQAWNRKAET